MIRRLFPCLRFTRWCAHCLAYTAPMTRQAYRTHVAAHKAHRDDPMMTRGI